VKGLVYDGTTKTGVVDGEGCSLTGNSAVNAGNAYQATATLDSTNYKWSDGTTDDKTIDWSIAKHAEVTGTTDAVSLRYSNTAEQTFTAEQIKTLLGDTNDGTTITITGVTAADKTYDQGTAAVVTGTAAVDGKCGNDDVTVVPGTAAFADKNVGAAKKVTFTDFALTGAAADNYILSAQPADVTAAITAKEVTVSGMEAADRVYKQGDLFVSVSGGTLTGVIDGDTVTVDLSGAKGKMANADVGNDKAVTVIGVTLGGADAGNYALSAQPTGVTVTITNAAAPTLGISGATSFRFSEKGEKTLTVTGIPTGETVESITVTDVQNGENVLTAAPTASGTTVTFDLKGFEAYETNLTASFDVTVKVSNHEEASINDVTITLLDKLVPTVSANDITVTYNGSAVPESKITGTATFEGVTVTGSWSFKDAAPVNVADSGTVKVVFTPDDTTNYAVVETEITVTIKKATPTGAPTYNMVTGNGHTLAEAGLAMGTIQPAGGTLAWELGDDAIIEEGVAYTWIYTPVDTDNYNVLTGTAVLCRNTPPAPGVRPSNPVKPGGDKPGDSDEPTLPPAASELPFSDVNTDTPCYESIAYVYENGLMNGVGNDQFAPNGTLNRAMVVTVLHRLEGAPEAAAASFTDVPAGQWYTGAVAWAAEKGVVNGYGDGKFGPEDAVTIQQLAVILYRYALLKGYDVTAVADLSIYADAAGVADWALAAMQWAVAEGLLTLDSNLLNAGATATRAQVAYALHHFMVNVIA